MKKTISLILAYFFLALAMVGAFLPLLPTGPFLILSAWFAVRGSEDLHKWLYAHPKYGQLLIDWEQHGAISRRNKIIAVVMIIISWLIMFMLALNPWLLAGLALLFVGTSSYVLSRPEPPANTAECNKEIEEEVSTDD